MKKIVFRIILTAVIALTMVMSSTSISSAAGKPIESLSVTFGNYNHGNLQFSVHWDNIRALAFNYDLYSGDDTVPIESGTRSASKATRSFSVLNATTGTYPIGSYRIVVVLCDAKLKEMGQYTDSDTKTFGPSTIFAQNFDEIYSGLPTGWTTTDATLCSCWYNHLAGGSDPELRMAYNPEMVNSDYRVSTPLINTTNENTALTLSFKQRLAAWLTTDPYYITVEVSTNGGATWEPTSYTINTPASDIGPETRTIDLTNWAGNTIIISWHLTGYTVYMNGYYVDDVVVSGY